MLLRRRRFRLKNPPDLEDPARVIHQHLMNGKYHGLYKNYYVYKYIYIYMYVCKYIYREREREWDVVRARVFQCFSLFVHVFWVFLSFTAYL